MNLLTRGRRFSPRSVGLRRDREPPEAVRWGGERRQELGVCLFLFHENVDAVVNDLTNYEISVDATFDQSYYYFFVLLIINYPYHEHVRVKFRFFFCCLENFSRIYFPRMLES